MAKACQAPELAGMFTSYQVNVPQLYADIDRTKARQLGVPVTDVFDTMQIYLGQPVRERLQQVRPHLHACACRPMRRTARAPRTSACSRCARPRGEMVPLSALMKVQPSFGPGARDALQRLPRRPTSTAAPAPGFSSGQAQDAIERIAAETLPHGIGFEWTDLTYQEILAGNSAMLGVPAGDPAGVPGAGRAVREPDAAAGDHPDRADGPAGRDDRRVADRTATTTSSRRSG